MALSPARVEALKKQADADQDIDFSDIPELNEAYFTNAKLVEPSPKEQITMCIDADVLEWFKARGKGYKTRMNAVLKAFVLSQPK
jgi:uncharacterized protein (DUF4415 family)